VFLVDDLTGAHRRDAGILELEREVARATRTQQPFVLAFVDVDALKEVNDSDGHAAGDELLRHVADAIRKHFRPYDLIVRYGGDEFLCGALDLGRDEVATRFELINADLAARGASVTAGLAELRPGEELAPLIQRADHAMYQQRHGTRDRLGQKGS
jgi:diguanylate cyclase (GGDEF)-like protein